MKRYLIIVIGVSLIAAGCTHEAMDSYSAPEVEGNMTFHAIYEGGDDNTKTVMTAKDIDGYYPIVWSAEDQLTIFCKKDTTGKKFTISSGAGTNNAVFQGEIVNDEKYYAIYPSKLNASFGANFYADEHGYEGKPDIQYRTTLTNGIFIPMPQTQKYAPDSFGVGYNPALAITCDTTLKFKNLCGVLQLNLRGDAKIGKISVRDLRTEVRYSPLWGTGIVCLNRDSYDENIDPLNPYFIIVNSAQQNDGLQSSFNGACASEIFLECDEAVQLKQEESTAFHIVLPVDALSEGFEMKVYDENGQQVYYFETVVANTIKRSYVKEMPVMTIVKASHSTDNLSKNGNANSYMVQPDGKEYCFDAVYRTNTAQRLGNVQCADVLWQTNNVLKESVGESTVGDVVTNVRYENGKVFFNSTTQSGNAVIAVKDANHKCLWSWHIWSTDYDPSSSYDTYSNGAVVMDRDLGALTDGDYGMYYEWRRKDPFVPWDKSVGVSSLYMYTKPSTPFNHSNTRGLELSISEPLSYMDGICWWGEGDPEPERWESEFDPCPPGWEVVDFDSFYLSENAVQYLTRPVYTNYYVGYYYAGGAVSSDRLTGSRYTSDLLPVRCQKKETGTNRSVIDLSEHGTANSYIVKPGEQYKIRVTTKGNSDESVGCPRAAVVLMDTNNDGATDCGILEGLYGYKDGYAYFNTSRTAKYGNAIIGIVDAYNTILWSWHIWCVDFDYSRDTYQKNGSVFMKFNLGALAYGEEGQYSGGLFYEWGRKDPFLPALSIDSNADATYKSYSYTFESAYIYNMESSDRVNTMCYAIRKPWVYIPPATNGGGDWMAEHDNTLWGAAKTVNDPCPVGWRVPTATEWGDSEYNVYLYGVKDSDNNWYPYCGHRFYNTGILEEVGSSGSYWTAVYASDGTANMFQANSSSQSIISQCKATGANIRCVKDVTSQLWVINE